MVLSATGGTGDYTFGGDATENLIAGTYNYTVTDENGCIATASATINDAPALLTLSANPTQIACAGGTGSVELVAEGGVAPYVFSGETADLAAGTYNYTVTDKNGCTANATATITEPDALIVSATAGAIACNGESTTVTVSATGGTAPYTGTGTFTVSAGSYSYTVSDANGCSEVVNVTISQPTAIDATASAGTITVPGGTTTLIVSANGGTSPYTYSLNGGGYQSSNTFTVNAGTYTVTVKDANGCTKNTNTVTVTEPTQGNTPTIVYYTGSRSVQYYSTVSLSAILFNGNNYRGIGGKTITFTIGSQSVTATTNSSGIASATLLITQAPGNYRVITTFDGDATYRSSSDNDAFTVARKTVYAGLTGTVTKVYDGNTTAYMSPSNYTLSGVVNGDNVSLNKPATGTYNNKSVGTGKRVTVTGLALTGTDAGKYTLSSTTVSAYIGVITSSQKSEEIVTPIEPTVGYADLKVYPNPFSDRLRFEFMSPESVDARIDLFDMTGRLVKTVFEQPIEGGVNYEADFKPETMISGIYIYRMTMGESVYNGKVIFKKE